MNRRVLLIVAAGVLAVSALVWLLIPRGGSGLGDGDVVPVRELPTPTPAPEQRIVLFFAGSDGLLHPELRNVPLPAEVDGRVRVVVEQLLVGPEGGLVAVVPYPAQLLGVFVDAQGHAFVNLTPPPTPLAGSHTELLMAYGLVDSVLLNCPELVAVQLLFSGEEVATLTGHLDLSRPLRLNKRFIAS